MNKNLRAALRLATYIRVLGGDPTPFRDGNYREWAFDLHRQHQRLRQGLPGEIVRAAEASVLALIKRKGYRRAAAEALPVEVTAAVPEQLCANQGGAAGALAAQPSQIATVLSAKERRMLKRDRYLCLRKMRHPDWGSAIQHASRLGKAVQIYECAVCKGLHVGHDPDREGTKQYRRTQKRLKAIGNRLVALEREQRALANERSKLKRELGRLDGLALVHPGFLEIMRRLLGIFGP